MKRLQIVMGAIALVGSLGAGMDASAGCPEGSLFDVDLSTNVIKTNEVDLPGTCVEIYLLDAAGNTLKKPPPGPGQPAEFYRYGGEVDGTGNGNFAVPKSIGGVAVASIRKFVTRPDGKEPYDVIFTVVSPPPPPPVPTIPYTIPWILDDKGATKETPLRLPEWRLNDGTIYVGSFFDVFVDLDFVMNTPLDTEFELDAPGVLSELEGYFFSSTPFVPVHGVGLVGYTPLAAGTKVTYVAYFELYAVPEPETVLLLGLSVLGIGLYRRRRASR